MSSGKWDLKKVVTLKRLVCAPPFLGTSPRGALSVRNSLIYPAVEGSPSSGDDFRALFMSLWEKVSLPSMLPMWIHTTGFLFITVSVLKNVSICKSIIVGTQHACKFRVSTNLLFFQILQNSLYFIPHGAYHITTITSNASGTSSSTTT